MTSTSAPDMTADDKIKNILEEVAYFHGSEKEKWVAVFCRQLGIDYTKLMQQKTQGALLRANLT